MEQLEYYSKISAKENNLFEFNPTTYITNSSLSAINPEEGGSPKKFLDYFKGDREKSTAALNLGTLIHKYHESPGDFIVADFEKPTGMKPAMIENIKTLGFKDLTMLPEPAFVASMEIAGYKRRPTLTDDDSKYLKYLWDSEGKVALTEAEKADIDKMITSLRNHPKVSQYLFEDVINIGGFSNKINENFKRLREFAIYWEDKNEIGDVIYRKALIDNYIFFPASNSIIKVDLKSTSSSVYKAGSTEDKKGWLESWNIYRQIGYYDEAIANLYLNENAYAVTRDGRVIKPKGKLPTIYNYVAGIETKNNFLSAMIQIPQDWTLAGLREAESLSNRILWHIKNNKWQYSKEEYENGGVLKVTERKDLLRLKK